MPEWVYAAALGVNTLSLLVVLGKLVWGGSQGLQAQFALLKETCADSVTLCRNDLLAKLELQSTNVGNVIANVGNRIHDLELKAMEARALAAETYMRRDSYHKATDDFKRDVRDANTELKKEMHAGFDELKDQIGAVSMSIEANRKNGHRAS